MFLPSRLGDTTVGDLLATLHREYTSGVLELVEPGRRHDVHLRRGLVHAVECSERLHRFGDIAVGARLCARSLVEGAWRESWSRNVRIGQQLVTRGAMSPVARDRVLDAQRLGRLGELFNVTDAEIRFHALRPLPAGSAERAPMSPREMFFGRARRRDGGRPMGSARREALRVLGLDEGATKLEARARYRERVAALHPDHAAHVNEHERAQRSVMLRAVIEAYRSLER